MTVKPYESEADREDRKKMEEEKRRREEEAHGANDKFRALDVRHAQTFISRCLRVHCSFFLSGTRLVGTVF